MGQTHYVTMTTREYALLSRLEGAVRALLNTPLAAAYQSETTGPARKAITETIAALDKVRAK